MSDGLLLTRGERLQRFVARAGLALAPSAVLAAVAFGVGAGAVGIAILVLAAVAAWVTGQSARTLRGAAIAGLVVCGLVFLLQLVLAWLGTHPILPR
jgi:hypothetical protein